MRKVRKARTVSSIPLKEGIFKFRGRDLVIFLTLKFIQILLYLLPIIYIGYLLIHYWDDVKKFALELNALGNLVSAILTIIIVFITGFYTLINHRMLTQMVETRQAQLRPTLWVTIDHPEFKKYEYSDDDSRYFATQAHVANYGKGAAVNIRIDYEIPYAWSDTYKRNERIHGSGKDDIPVLLSPNDVFDNTINISTNLFTFENVYHTYLTLQITYEDTERTLYEMNQIYYLYPHPSSDINSYYLYLESESLHFVPFHKRTRTTDIEESVSDEGILIFSRKMPWRLD